MPSEVQFPVPVQSEVTYLDYAGAALPSNSLLEGVFNDVINNPLGNPHSRGGKLGNRSHDVVESIRKDILSFVGASSEEYMVVFTSGCTAGLKLVGECFPWSSSKVGSQKSSKYVYASNSHNSLMGIRGLAPKWSTIAAHNLFGDEEITSEKWRDIVEGCEEFCAEDRVFVDRPNSLSLLGIPGECNFTGSKVNLQNLFALLDTVRSSSEEWLWLLDGGKLFADSNFKISEQFPAAYMPDFIALTFYKIFGYPTGIGALLIRRKRLTILQKRYYGGGTLLAGAADSSFLVAKSCQSPDHFEDGTINYHGIAALKFGFQFIQGLGGMQAVESYAHEKRQYLLQGMLSMHHTLTNRRLCTIYSFSDGVRDATPSRQGPVIAFNLHYADGIVVPFGVVSDTADTQNIQIRTGCFCNLGGCQELLQISAEDMEVYYFRGRQCSEDRDRAADVLYDRPTGACRISVGYGTTTEDCDIFLQFLRDHFLNHASPAADETDDDVGNAYHHRLLNSKSKEGNNARSVVSDQDLFWTQKVQYFVPDRLLSSAVPSSSMSCTESIPTQLTAIFVYPVKSCAGVRVDNWPLLPPHGQGLLYDRTFAIIDENGRVLSQKMYPMLALIRPYFHFDHRGESEAVVNSVKEYIQQSVVTLRLTSPYNDTDLELLLDFGFEYFPSTMTPQIESSEHAAQTLRVCGRKVATRRISSDADQWITSFFRNSHTSSNGAKPFSNDQRFHIVRTTADEPSSSKSSSKAKTSASSQGSTSISSSSFANTAQFLLLSTESVRSLIHLIEEEDTAAMAEADEATAVRCHKVKVENFRPNLVVSSSVAHEEDLWQRVDFSIYQASADETALESTVSMEVTGPCARCTMVDVNSDTGKSECRVFEALDAYRKQRGHGVCFGQFIAVPDQSSESQGKDWSLSLLKVGTTVSKTVK